MDTQDNDDSASPCTINATRGSQNDANNFDGRWIQAAMTLPDTYSCSDCWWKVRYEFAGSVQDTTTWRAYIVGNPIHLVPTG
jgi:hypothetical protein